MGPWLSWESAAFATRRPRVRTPSGPPSRRKQGVCPAFFVPRNQPKGFEAAGQRRGRNSPVDCGAGAGPRPARGRSKEEGARGRSKEEGAQQRPGRPLRRELASGNSTHCCCILMMWRTISKKFSTCAGLSPCMANSGRRNTLKIRRKHAWRGDFGKKNGKTNNFVRHNQSRSPKSVEQIAK